LGAEASRRNGVRAFDTLLRYRGTTLDRTERCKKPIEPKGRQNPGEMLSLPAADEPQAQTGPAPTTMTLPARQSRGLIPETAPGRQRRRKTDRTRSPHESWRNHACGGVVEPAPGDADDPGR
jgi:hypothetical protein